VINLKYNVKFYFWKRAVKGLVEKHSSYRFIHVIMPAVGWALYLGLDRSKVENYLKKVLKNRSWKKTKRDIEIAYRKAPPLKFSIPNGFKKYNLEEILKKVFDLLLQEEIVQRQKLRKVLNNQTWLTDLIMDTLTKMGWVETEFIKMSIGRPRKTFRLTESGKQIAQNFSKEIVEEFWKTAIELDFSSGKKNRKFNTET